MIIQNAKRKAKERRKQQAYLGSELKKLENNLESSENLRKYESLKNNLQLIYDHIAEGISTAIGMSKAKYQQNSF